MFFENILFSIFNDIKQKNSFLLWNMFFFLNKKLLSKTVTKHISYFLFLKIENEKHFFDY